MNGNKKNPYRGCRPPGNCLRAVFLDSYPGRTLGAGLRGLWRISGRTACRSVCRGGVEGEQERTAKAAWYGSLLPAGSRNRPAFGPRGHSGRKGSGFRIQRGDFYGSLRLFTLRGQRVPALHNKRNGKRGTDGVRRRQRYLFGGALPKQEGMANYLLREYKKPGSA